MNDIVHYDCRFFKGHIPCLPNKQKGAMCGSCSDYQPVSKRILFIKLGAIGDVIRTTPLAVRFRQLYPHCHITWVTHSPAVLPAQLVDEIMKWDATSLYRLPRQPFDIAINLDKEPEACMLLSEVKATEKYGFSWENGHLSAATPAARHKLMTGLFDQLSQANTKDYMTEIFEICHLDFKGEPYQIRLNQRLAEKWQSLRTLANGKKIVGLNTGCGARWQTRLWPAEKWEQLIVQLQQKGYFPLLMGGPDEDAQNRAYAQQTGAHYPGHFPLEEFIAISTHTDLIVTQVSMMMHIAIALQKKLVLQNNIFNKHEFELYGNGIIVEPESGCDCYYGQSCTRTKRCMHDISVEKMIHVIETLLPDAHAKN